MQDPDEKKLNDRLCPDDFKIAVPIHCKLFRDWSNCERWRKYVKTLAPERFRRDDPEAECGWTHDCRPAWILTGDLAIAHACNVHSRIHRQALTFDQVSAIDVGFAILEREMRFGNFLAIRVHVNRKLPPELLTQRGSASFNRPYYAYMTSQTRRACSQEECSYYEMWVAVRTLMRRELDGRRRRRAIRQYPITGVQQDDLSLYCPPEIADIRELNELRLCICGVPIDIVNAHYSRYVEHPGGDAERGTFVSEPRRSNQLPNDEQLLIGRGRINPLAGGVSVGSVTGQAGTLSAIVWDRTDGTPCILSNWHVLAGTSIAQVGQPTYQPALFDGGTEDDQVAELKRWHLGEQGDAAIAELNGCRDYAAGEVLGLWHPLSGYLPPRLNMEIRKWGRTTGFTQGFVDGICLATNIDYGNEVVRYFRDQFHIAPLLAGTDVSQVGDSGSLVVTSFSPVAQHEALVRLLKWLRECCNSQATPALCAEIPEKVRDFLADCRCLNRKTGWQCTDFCEALDCLEIPHFQNELPPNNLNRFLTGLRQSLVVPYEEIKNTIAKYIDGIDHLEQLYKQCHKCADLKANELKNLYIEIIQDFTSNNPPSSEADGLSVSHSETAKLALKDLSRPDTCRYIERELDKETDKLEALRRFLEFASKVKTEVEGWYDLYCDIEAGARQCRDICRILQGKCREIKFEDPLSIVTCIEEQLTGFYDEGSCGSRLRPWFVRALQAQGVNLGEDQSAWFRQLLNSTLNEDDLLFRILQVANERRDEHLDYEHRNMNRAYYAVGMIFAGDTPGSPFGEFAVASDIQRLEEELRFSLRPVYEPRSSFRELRERQPRQGRRPLIRSGSGISPGDLSGDPDGTGPQPDPESAVPNTLNRPPSG